MASFSVKPHGCDWVFSVDPVFSGFSPICFQLNAVWEKESAQSSSQSLYVSVMSVLPWVGRFESGLRGGAGGGGGFTATMFMIFGSVLMNSHEQQGMEKVRTDVCGRTNIWTYFYLLRPNYKIHIKIVSLDSGKTLQTFEYTLPCGKVPTYWDKTPRNINLAVMTFWMRLLMHCLQINCIVVVII